MKSPLSALQGSLDSFGGWLSRWTKCIAATGHTDLVKDRLSGVELLGELPYVYISHNELSVFTLNSVQIQN